MQQKADCFRWYLFLKVSFILYYSKAVVHLLDVCQPACRMYRMCFLICLQNSMKLMYVEIIVIHFLLKMVCYYYCYYYYLHRHAKLLGYKVQPKDSIVIYAYFIYIKSVSIKIKIINVIHILRSVFLLNLMRTDYIFFVYRNT